MNTLIPNLFKYAIILREGKMDEVTKMELKEPNSKFIKIRCPKCKNEQITFGKSATKVNCLVCAKKLAEPTGGKTRFKARILEVLD